MRGRIQLAGRRLVMMISAAILAACSNGLELSVEFEEQNGLSEGDAVYFKDVEVGSVDGISPRPEAPGVRVVLDIDPQRIESLGQDSVAMITEKDGVTVVELYASRTAGEPVTSGSGVRGLNSIVEYTAWRTRQAVEITQSTLEDVTAAVNSYFHGDEWRRQKEKIEAGIRMLEQSAGDTWKSMAGDVDRLVDEFESRSKDAGKEAERRYKELSTALKTEIENLVEQGHTALAESTEKMLEALEEAMRRYREQPEN